MPVALVEADRLVLLLSAEGKRYLIRPQAGGSWFTDRGRLEFDDLIGQPFGQTVTTHLGQTFLMLRPTTADLIHHLKRTTQIVYPKDAAHLVMELDLWDGRRLIEAGTGSGGLTLAFRGR